MSDYITWGGHSCLPFGLTLAALISAVGLSPLSSRAEIVGIWHFNEVDDGKVPNRRLAGGGVDAVLRDFAKEDLADVDVHLADFLVARHGMEKTVQVAKSGWATFKNVPDNGLRPGVNTPVGKRALAIYSSSKANWVHFPGLATALVGKSGGAIRDFGFSAWYIMQTKGDPPQFATKNTYALLRLGRVDGRIMCLPGAADRIRTEDVGNGLGGSHSYRLPRSIQDAFSARWVHITFTTDGKADKARMFVNGTELEYTTKPEPTDGYDWPKPGGLEINYKKDTEQDGAVIGRWLGGAAASDNTFGLAGMVIVKGETIDQQRARYLYELGRRGIPFNGVWFEKKFGD